MQCRLSTLFRCLFICGSKAWDGHINTVSRCSNKHRLSPLQRLRRAAPSFQAWSIDFDLQVPPRAVPVRDAAHRQQHRPRQCLSKDKASSAPCQV